MPRFADVGNVQECTAASTQDHGRWDARVNAKERIVRTRTFRNVTAGVIFIYLAYASVLLAPRAICMNLLSLLLLGMSWFADSRLKRDKLGAHLFLLCGLVSLFGASLGDENLRSSGFWHLPLLSMGARFLLGTQAAILWFVVAAVAIGVQAYLHANYNFELDYPFSRENVLTMRTFGIVVGAVFGHLSSKTTRARVRLQRCQMQELQEASVRAAQANEAKSNFLAQVSHELRTPMNGILGMTQFLQHRESLNPEAREPVETIHRCSTSLLDLFREILDLSRVESADWNIQSQPMNLVAVVQDVCELFAAQANTDQRTLRVECEHEAFWMRGDAVRLSQVLSNLVGNSVKFCERGEIVIALRIEKKNEFEEGPSHRVQILVQDQGIGMSESQELAVFTEFVQVKSQHSEGGKGGTGLGLVISRELMEKMGGSLELSSSLDVGTTFTIEFQAMQCPCAPASNAFVPSRARTLTPFPAPRAKGTLRVLVVDDLAINRRVACLSLRRLGCEVEEAEDGEQAVMKAEQRAYDCIFMDLRMPKMDGFEACEKILSESTCNRTTPIVALSASAFDEDRARCFKVGMVEHVAKPFRSADLQAVLDAHVLDGDKKGLPCAA